MARENVIEKRRNKLKSLLFDGIAISNCAEILEVARLTLAKDFIAMRNSIAKELGWEGSPIRAHQLVMSARVAKLHTLLTLGYAVAECAKLLGLSRCYIYTLKNCEQRGEAKIRIKITRPIVAVDCETNIPMGEYDAIRVGNANIALCGDSRTYIANGEVVAESHKLISVYRT